MDFRPYQTDSLNKIYQAWDHGHRVIMLVSPTGSGKTVVMSEVIRRHVGASVVIAHRQELVSQISQALARCGVRHRIIGPSNVVRLCISNHIDELGRDYYDSSSQCAVAGVNTLINRADDLKSWCQQVTLWLQDEGHHLLLQNSWGKAVAMFPNARGLAVTATPERADGKGLGRHADGLIDHMIVSTGMRDLINQDYLTDYRVFCPPSDLDLTDIKTGADGDYVRGQLALKTKASSIMGDVVSHYLRIAPGKLGVTFAPDVETAGMFAKGFLEAGVPAEVVSAKTPDRVRQSILKRFKRREILQLVNVDLFGEGFDLPAIEVCSMARATESYALFVQQFGRALRLMDGKHVAYIIDHVGNVIRHGLPDAPRQWSLDRRDRRAASKKDDDVIPMRTCLNPECFAPFERVLVACPFCGWIPVPVGRTAPEMVDGDLFELDPEVLAAMRGEVAKIDRDPSAVRNALTRAGNPYMVAKGAENRHRERQDAQSVLREVMALWGGFFTAQGKHTREAQRRFYHRFGVDVMSAQCLGRADAESLTGRITDDLIRRCGNVGMGK